MKKRKALVTGGSKGIGKAIVEILREEEYEVTSVSRNDGYDIWYDLDDIVDITKDFDILINNVGGGGTWKADDFDEIMFINYKSTGLLVKAFLDKKRKWGRIITISSIYGKEKGPNPWFAAAKAAQIALMKSFAGKYNGITFNTICPGHISVGKPFPDKPEIIGQPEDVAHLVAFLCSDKAKHINGATITVDGGESHSF